MERDYRRPDDIQSIRGRRRRISRIKGGHFSRVMTSEMQHQIREVGEGKVDLWLHRLSTPNRQIRRVLQRHAFKPAPQELMDRYNHHRPSTFGEIARGEIRLSLPLTRNS